MTDIAERLNSKRASDISERGVEECNNKLPRSMCWWYKSMKTVTDGH